MFWRVKMKIDEYKRRAGWALNDLKWKMEEIPAIGNTAQIKRDKKLEKVDRIISAEPANGALLYCQLGPVEHSGIYIGGGNIVDLNGNGEIHTVSIDEFTCNIATIDKKIYAPYSKNTGVAIGLPIAAERAKTNVGGGRNYNFILDNCHQFCAGCISGDFNNEKNFLWMLKSAFEAATEQDLAWKTWDWKYIYNYKPY